MVEVVKIKVIYNFSKYSSSLSLLKAFVKLHGCILEHNFQERNVKLVA